MIEDTNVRFDVGSLMVDVVVQSSVVGFVETVKFDLFRFSAPIGL